MDLRDRIRVARKQAKLTQEYLAREAKVSLKSIQKLESGDIEDPHISTLTRIASVLGVSFSELAGVTEATEEEVDHPKVSARSNSGREITRAGGIESAEAFGTPEVINLQLTDAELVRFLETAKELNPEEAARQFKKRYAVAG